jgi:hypothetical protein
LRLSTICQHLIKAHQFIVYWLAHAGNSAADDALLTGRWRAATRTTLARLELTARVTDPAWRLAAATATRLPAFLCTLTTTVG